MHESRISVWRARAGRLALGAGANVAGALGGIVRNKLFAHHLGTDGMGALAQVLTGMVWLGTASAMGFGLPVAQKVGEATARDDDDSVRRTISTALVAIGVMVACVALLLAVFAPAWAKLLLGEGADPTLVRLALVGVGGLAFQGTIQGLFAGRSDLQAPLTYAIIGNLAATVAVVALVPPFGLRGAVIGASCFYPAAILGTLAWHRATYRAAFLPAPSPRFDRARAGAMFKVAGTALALSVIDLGTMLVIRTHFAHAEGLAANGLFQAALSLSQQGGAVFYAYLGSYAFGKISGAGGEDGVRRYTQRQWSPLIATASVAFVLAMILASPLLRLLFSNQFDPARPMMLWTLTGEFGKVAMQAWIFGSLPLGGVRLFFPLGASFAVGLAAGYIAARALGLGPMSLAAAYAFAGGFALLVSGTIMSRRGVPLTPRGMLLILASLATLFSIAWFLGRG